MKLSLLKFEMIVLATFAIDVGMLKMKSTDNYQIFCQLGDYRLTLSSLFPS